MNITFKHIISACILLTVGLSACSDDSMDNYTPVNTGDAVKFAASSGATTSRTIYDDENIFQINWEDQDQIMIYSNKAFEGRVYNADYKVTPIETAEKSNNKLYNTGTIAAVGGTQLQWADNTEHKFIGVYPNNANIKVNAETGIVTFPIDRNQVVQGTVRLKDEAAPGKNDFFEKYDPYYKKYKDGGYTYYCKPDMKNAYLVASNTITPAKAAESNGDVFLNFKPVMTTLEIIVKGATIKDETSGNDRGITITGVSVIRQLPRPGGEVSTSFRYNAITNSLDYSNIGSEAPVHMKETTFISFSKDKEITLYNNESAVFTVFMPPFEMNELYPISINVHATGATEVSTSVIPAQGNSGQVIKAGDKRRITLPAFPTTLTSNNWMTRLDDNIYVSQLSIPGTHDSGTGEGMYGSSDNKDDIGQTQDRTITQQLNMGIRAFDLRPCNYSGTDGSDIWIYHGVLSTKVKWDGVNPKNETKKGVITQFKEYLEAHPGEFIIALIRHEKEWHTFGTDGSILPKNMNNLNYWAKSMRASFDKIKAYTNNSTKESLVVDFRPDLTIGECRGKILFLCRCWDKPDGKKTELECPYTYVKDDNIKTSERKPTVGGYIGWNHTANGAEVDIWGPTGNKGKLYIQDCFSKAQDGVGKDFISAKKAAIKKYLDLTKTFHSDPNLINHWSINHTSGYINDISNTTAYRRNAEAQNPEFYKILSDPTWEGSTGIVLSDWVGDDVSAGIKVMGARMPQIIIDNNFKYRMQRKQ